LLGVERTVVERWEFDDEDESGELWSFMCGLVEGRGSAVGGVAVAHRGRTGVRDGGGGARWTRVRCGWSWRLTRRG
jgi:hypothetical protein